MIILGLSTMGASSASLFIDNKLVAAVEEERLSRIKNDDSFPFLSINECLRIANIKISDIDVVNVYWRPWKVKNRIFGVLNKIFKSRQSRKNILKKLKDHFSLGKKNNKGSWIELFFIKNKFKRLFGYSHFKVNYFDHHLTHMIYAENINKWKDSIILSYDGGGEELSTVLSVRKNGYLKRIKSFKWPNSLGHFYSFFTGYLGFKMLEGEYKMMGLAPYGNPVYSDTILNKIIKLKKNGEYKINLKLCDYHSALNNIFNDKLSLYFPKPLKQGQKPSKDHIDLACSVQNVFEIVEAHIIKHVQKDFKNIDNLVVTGGCGLNVSANGRVIENCNFKKVIVPPAPHDAGCSIGSNLIYLNKNYNIGFEKIETNSPYLGSEFSNNEIKIAFKSLNLSVPDLNKSNKDTLSKAAHFLSKGKIIAWFQGKVEFGPRALGSRSFLADPRKDSIREKINQKIKKRELFRPFAPSTILEKSKEYFELNQESPYMNIVAKVKKDQVSNIPAVTHTDGTARVHTVTEKSNKIYYDLIKKFGDITGVYVLLNTSFNIQEPIVYSPSDAIKTFLKSGVDFLIIGDYICDENWRKKNKL